LPVSLGPSVIIGIGNISAAAIDHDTGRIYAIYYKTENNMEKVISSSRESTRPTN
jgi:hypothetical protein